MNWTDVKEWAHAYSSKVSEMKFSEPERDPDDALVSWDIDRYFRACGFKKDIDCITV